MKSIPMERDLAATEVAATDPFRAILVAAFRLLIGILPDRLALSLLYLRHFGRWPNLDRPRSFSEKIQARKLAPRNPVFPGLVDKIEVKRMVSQLLGPEWVIPTLWTGRQLPPMAERNWPLPFVLKANNGSGTNIFVRSPAECDWAAIEPLTRQWMQQRYTPRFREWPYALIEPCLLIEPFIGSSAILPLDYKFYVFNGRVEYVQVDVGRENDHHRCFYDRDWQKQPFTLYKPMEPSDIVRPASFDRMIAAAEALARDLDFVRIDFYEIDGNPLFGEMTLFPESGLAKFSPGEWDMRFGDLWSPAWIS
jgi:TupA-like ATPgrasp